MVRALANPNGLAMISPCTASQYNHVRQTWRLGCAAMDPGSGG